MIDSKDPSSNVVKSVAEPYIAGFEGVEYEVISNYTIDKLYKQVGHLPSNAIVLFTPVVSDTTGKFFIPRHVLSSLTKKIRLRLAELEFPKGDKLTVSIGVLEYKQDDDFQLWFRRADSALYQAKSKGRNRSLYIPSDN